MPGNKFPRPSTPAATPDGVKCFAPHAWPEDPVPEDLLPTLIRARNGEAGSLEQLLVSAQAVLQSMVSRRLRGGWSETWIDDIVQECLIDVARSYRDCRAEQEREVIAWLAAIVRRELAGFFRHEAVRSAEPLPVDLAVPEDAPPSSRWEPALAWVKRELSQVSPNHQYLLWGRLVCHMTWREIGRTLGVPPSAAKRRFQRLLAHLRKGCPAPAALTAGHGSADFPGSSGAP